MLIMPFSSHKLNAWSSLEGRKRWLLWIGVRLDAAERLNLLRNWVKIFNVVITIGLDEYYLGERGRLEVTSDTREQEGHGLASIRHQLNWGNLIQYNISVYSTALLNAVERSIHFHRLSRLPVVNYFLIMIVANHIMTAVKESGLIHVFRITPQVVR